MAGGTWGEKHAEKTVCKGEKYKPWEQRVPLSPYPAIIAAINQFCGAIYSAVTKCTEGAGRVLASNPPSGSLLQLTTRTPAFQTSLAKDAVAFCHFSLLGSTSSPEDNLPPYPPRSAALPSIFSSLVLSGWARGAKFRPLLPRIEQTCICKHILHADVHFRILTSLGVCLRRALPSRCF